MVASKKTNDKTTRKTAAPDAPAVAPEPKLKKARGPRTEPVTNWGKVATVYVLRGTLPNDLDADGAERIASYLSSIGEADRATELRARFPSVTGQRGRKPPTKGDVRTYRAQQIKAPDGEMAMPFIRLPLPGATKEQPIRCTFNVDGSILVELA